MAERRKLRSGGESVPEPDLLPLMNIIFMLILALITMSAMLPLGFLSSNAQKLAGGGALAMPEQKEEKQPLNLIVFITESGFNISVRGNLKIGESDPKDPKKKLPFIPKIIDASGTPVYDYATLKAKLEEIKDLDKEEEKMTLTADPEVIFDVVVQTMDWTRFTKEKKAMFPAVSFAAGIVG